jgi:hypothetical protein
MTKFVAVLKNNGIPERAWEGAACIYNAYRWTHHKYCLDDEGFKPWQLPSDLEITFHLMTEEQFQELTK